jgi:hypothetical protein
MMTVVGSSIMARPKDQGDYDHFMHFRVHPASPRISDTKSRPFKSATSFAAIFHERRIIMPLIRYQISRQLAYCQTEEGSLLVTPCGRNGAAIRGGATMPSKPEGSR